MSFNKNMSFDLPPYLYKMNQSRALEIVFEKSARTLQEITDSVHSKTLDSLYTDTFRPEHTRSGETTVMDLQTGNPIKAFVEYIKIKGKNIHSEHTREYRLRDAQTKKILGTKSFGLTDYKDKEPHNLKFGFIESYNNDEIAGTQIRLLQAACEVAKKFNIKEIPLISMIPSVIFHTKMGFRPRASFDVEIKSLENVESLMTLLPEYNYGEVRHKDITPIISKRDGSYYLDRNRSLYCAAIKRMFEKSKETGNRNFPFPRQDAPFDITMRLNGNELEKWFNRIKGFEILPEKDIPKRKNIIEAIAVFINNLIS